MTLISRVVILFAAILIFQTAATHAQSFGKAELISAATSLEANPFADDAKALRGRAVQYVIETSDVSVVVCGGEITRALLDKKNKNSTELVAQYTIGMAAFKLQNSDNSDENAAQLAGLESTLKVYEAMVQKKPKTKHAGMEDLLAKRNSNTLSDLVAKADCGKK
jgi:hypothetical protein